ncbi:hypothetical protein QF035_007096 [Streptomyces umbrinus]|uniref:Trypsin-co-occurring domain-containing protein n=1 Tax=Streptomyces umbrinus TaxID=67370 RepID=A0ABU0T3X9_9ACTN|nr:hypothetical protein [Streptomyces umbrinus]
MEIEFGVKLTAEAGALIAKSAVEGHLVVKLSWSPDGSSGGSGGSDGSPGPAPGSPEATPVS